MMRIGASVPPDVPDAEGDPPDDELADAQRGQRGHGEPAGERVVDDVVADAEGPRHEQTRATPRPAAPTIGCQASPNGQAPEHGLDGEQAPGDQHCQQAAGEAERGEQRELAEAAEAVRRHGEQRPVAEQQRRARRRRRSSRRRAG